MALKSVYFQILKRIIFTHSSIFKHNSSTKMAENGTFNKIYKKRGAFIVFEGLDKCGKTTQSKLLVDRLNEMGVSAALLKFPTREGPIGEMVDKYLKNEINLTDESIHLLFSADRWENKKKLLDLLHQGTTVIVDRYAYSGVAFSAAKGLDFDWCTKSDVGLPAPDRVLYLNMAPHEAVKRKEYGAERYEELQFQLNVYKQYQRLSQAAKHMGNEWIVFDCNKSLEEVQEDIFRQVLPYIEDGIHKDVGQLFM